MSVDSEDKKEASADWKCPRCGAVCSVLGSTCMYGSPSKETLFYCDRCRRTYSCDEKGQKTWVN
ncbi:MAG: hypothetical protein ACI4KF_11760 [Huintestinicola sp.]